MAKNNHSLLFNTFLVILLLSGGLLAACAPGTDALEAQAAPPTPEVLLPLPSPMLAAPLVSMVAAGDETAVPEPTSLPATPTLEIIATETAVPTLETPAIIHPTYPLPTPSGAYSWTLRVPILMYHYISVPPADADIYRQDLSVTPENFRQQMAYLAENGYTPIDLYQLSAAITAKTDLPDKPVILTFDDGYLDNYENAFPVLQEFGFPGTFFIITDYADQGAAGYANWEQLAEMAAAGMRIETHTKKSP
ncbi:MAG: polysaccharide deacetylase family protein [Chloroflexi bacterium]|nr:polysaccharide deacetylase family protein [Chloroflexota bacterium]